MSESDNVPTQLHPVDVTAVGSFISMALMAVVSGLLVLLPHPSASDLHVEAVQAAQSIEPDLSCNGTQPEQFDSKLLDIAQPHFRHVVGTTNSLGKLLQPSNRHECRPAEFIPPPRVAENDDEEITRLTGEAVRSVDAILAMYHSDSNLPQPTFRSLQNLRAAFVRIAYIKGDIQIARAIVWLTETMVLLLSVAYMIFTFVAIRPVLPDQRAWFNLLAIASTGITFFVSLVILATRDFVNVAYFVMVLMLIAMVYARLLVPVLRMDRYCGLLSFVRLLLWGASSYFIVLLAVAIAYFYGELSVGAYPFRMARLNVATAFWTVALSIFAIHLLRRGSRTTQRTLSGWLCIALGPGAFCASVVYYNSIGSGGAAYPGNILYSSLFDGVQSRAALIEIALPRMMISLPLIFIILRRLMARIHNLEAIKMFLEANGDLRATVSLELLPRFRVNLRRDGVLFPNPATCLPREGTTDVTPLNPPLVTTPPHNTASRSMAVLLGLLRSTRPVNVLMALVLASVAYVSTSEVIALSAYGMTLVSVAFAVAGSFIVNDVADRAIDRLNNPTRAIADGIVSPSMALAVGILLLSLAPLVATLVSASLAILCFAVCIASIFYSFYLKSRNGIGANMLSAILTATLCFVGFDTVEPSRSMIGIAIAVFFAALAREIAKDVEDLPGDRLFRRATLAMATGPLNATKVAIGVAGIQIAASYIPFAFSDASLLYFVGITIANIILLRALTRAYKEMAARLVQRAVKLSMALYLVTYIGVISILGGL